LKKCIGSRSMSRSHFRFSETSLRKGKFFPRS
jgi:hypothetical protein